MSIYRTKRYSKIQARCLSDFWTIRRVGIAHQNQPTVGITIGQNNNVVRQPLPTKTNIRWALPTLQYLLFQESFGIAIERKK
jgi:hypothetical protein